MSVNEKHIFLHWASTQPTTDAVTNIGGGFNSTAKSTKLVFEDISTNSTLTAFSDSHADLTGHVSIWGRNSSGEFKQDRIELDGHTAAASSSPITFERLLRAQKSGTMTGNIAVAGIQIHRCSAAAGNSIESIKLGATASAVDNAYQFHVVRLSTPLTGHQSSQVREVIRYDGTNKIIYVRDFMSVPTATGVKTNVQIYKGMVFDKLAYPKFTTLEVLKISRPFWLAAAEASGGNPKNYFDKCFVRNLHTTHALTNATIAEVNEGLASIISFATAGPGLDDRRTNGANVRTTSGAITNTFDSTTKNILNSQNLSTGKAQGIWIKLGLTAGASAQDSYYKVQISGQSV